MAEQVYAHFVGIGGAGMSGLALVLHDRGVAVSGSDLKESRYARALADRGVPVFIGHEASNLPQAQVVVASSAITETNPELVAARQRGLPIWPRARMLAHLSDGRKTIAIAGTHGKTSTSSMVAVMLAGMGLDPTFLIGGEIDGLDTNACNGAGEHYVVEADESDGSFVFLRPHVAVVTNVEADHLDHYGSLEEIEQTFVEFLGKTDPTGTLVVCGDEPGLRAMAERAGRRVVTYGSSEHCDVRYSDITREGVGSRFRVTAPGGSEVSCSVAVPGGHMVSNATAAMAVAWVLELDLERAAGSLSGFTGVRRRFDLIGEVGGVTVVDDYAHHPTEVAATLTAASGLGFARVVAIFQPHRYSRTQAFAAEFGRSFRAADRVALLDVYSAGEAPIPGVSGKSILDAMLADAPRTQAAYLPHRPEVVDYLERIVRPGDLVLTMGAGDVTSIGPELVRALEERSTGARS